MSDVLVVNRWRRYGKDRLYVQRADESKVGFWDLLTETAHPETPADHAALVEAVAGWKAENPGFASAPVPSKPVRSAFRVEGYVRPDDVLGAPPDRERKVLGAIARVVLGSHQPAGRFDDEGEDKVAAQLAVMVEKDPRWLVEHVSECGAAGLGFDHVAIGPAGVFLIGSRLLTKREVWVKGDTFMVDGTRFSYVTDMRASVAHVAGVLSRVCGFPVKVTGVLATVDAYELKVKDTPEGVEVIARMLIEESLRKRRAVLPDEEQVAIFDVVCDPATWVQG